MSGVGRLATMANDIAAFFAVDSDRDVAIVAMVDHLDKFWTPRMRQKLISECRARGEDLAPLVHAALERITLQKTV